MLKFIQKIFQNRKKEYYILLIIFAILASFEYCSLAIYSSLNATGFEAIILNSLPVLSTFIALVLNAFVLKYFIENKKQEFSILLLSGRRPKDLFLYIIIQFGVLSLIAFLIGIGGGSLLMLMINLFMKSTSLPILFEYSFIQTLFIYILFFIITIVLILSICSHQFVILDKNLVNYLSHNKSIESTPYKIAYSQTSIINGVKTKRKIPFFAIIQTLFMLYITVFSCIQLVSLDLDSQYLYLFYATALAGIVAIVNSSIPLFYDLFHSMLLKHPVLLNTLAYFNDFSSIMMTLVNLNAFLVSTMVFIVILTGQNILLNTIVIPCFIMTLIMVGLCFILRYSLYDKNIRQHIATYNAIGYSPQKLEKILILKNILFGIFGILMPLFLFIILSYKAYLTNILTKSIGIGLSVIYMVLYLCILIYMFIKEKKMLKEVTHHVEYLNRS